MTRSKIWERWVWIDLNFKSFVLKVKLVTTTVWHAKSLCFSFEIFISILKPIYIYLIYIVSNGKKDTSTMHFGYTISVTNYTARENLRRKGHSSWHLERMHSIIVGIHSDDAWWQMWGASCSHCINCDGAKSQRIY